MTGFIRTYGRAIIAVLVALFTGLFGDADPAAFEGFLENLVANGEVSLGTTFALLTHYIGDVKLGLFDPPEEPPEA